MSIAEVSFSPKEAKIIEELKKHFNQEGFNRPEAIRKIACLRGRHNRPAGFDQSLFDKMNEAEIVIQNSETKLYSLTDKPFTTQKLKRTRNLTFKTSINLTY